MLRRFKVRAAAAPPPPMGVRIDSVQFISDNSTSVTERTNIAAGPAGGSVTMKVTNYVATNPAQQYFNVVGVGNLHLNDTFVLSLGAGGGTNFTTITYAGTTPGRVISVQLTIVSVNSGVIGNPSSRGYSKTS